MDGKVTCSPSALRVALCACWHVLRRRRLRHLPRVLALLEAVLKAAPNAVTPQHGVRLRLGLQAAAVHFQLQEPHSEPQLFDSIDLYFPEGPPLNWGRGLQPPIEQLQVLEAQQDFRDSILPLIWDPKKRRDYLKGPAIDSYGPHFLLALEQLCFHFLYRIDSALPSPDRNKIYDVIWSHAPLGPRPPSLPIMERYLGDMGHAPNAPPTGAVPRPLSSARQQSCQSKGPAPSKSRPPGRQLRPLRVRPLEFLSQSEEREGLRRKTRSSAFSFSTPDVDRERDRDRYRTHRQGGADQGARGGEGRDPTPTTATDLQREADERREDGGRLQDPGGVGASPRVGFKGRGRGQRQATPTVPANRNRPS